MSRPTPELHTQRLRLHAWTAADRDDFAVMNADPEVMEYFPSTLTREQSDALVDRIERVFAEHGFGLWAVEADGEFIGFTGLWVPTFHAELMDSLAQPVVEVGWRLRRTAWGNGYATEAARESLRYGFDDVGLSEIVSFTVRPNLRSQAVMRRLEMQELTNYDHPVPGSDPMPSVCYLLSAAEFRRHA